jgi:DNA-binding protein Fis
MNTHKEQSSVHEAVSHGISSVLMGYIHDLDGSDPDELIQCVLNTLDDFVTDMKVSWTRVIETEDGHFIRSTFETNV